MISKIRRYSDLLELSTFDERYSYLRMDGFVGEETFGYDRYLNQMLYSSKRWRAIRDTVMIRDNGFDLGLSGYPIRGRVIVHHMNPITIEDLERNSELVLDPNFLISVSHRTHLAIHYGNEKMIEVKPIKRRPGDTTPWLKKG